MLFLDCWDLVLLFDCVVLLLFVDVLLLLCVLWFVVLLFWLLEILIDGILLFIELGCLKFLLFLDEIFDIIFLYKNCGYFCWLCFINEFLLYCLILLKFIYIDIVYWGVKLLIYMFFVVLLGKLYCE